MTATLDRAPGTSVPRRQGLILKEVQIRDNGDTPTFPPERFREVLGQVGANTGIYKFSMTFVDENGQTVLLTLRETEDGWVVYGKDFSEDSESQTVRMPTFTDEGHRQGYLPG